MKRYVLGRLAQTIVTWLVISLFVFGMERSTGNPLDMMLPIDAGPELRAEMAHEFALDRPVAVQYLVFLAGLARGDLGISIRSKMPVSDLIGERLPNTLELAGAALVLALACAFPLGVLGAMRPGGWIDRLAQGVALLGQSVPSFWAGIVLISIFSVRLGLLPAGRQGGLDHLVLPAVTLGLFGFMLAGVVRLLRGAMIETLGSDYIRFARIKGLSEAAIGWRHALANALLPVITFIGFYFGILLSGTVVVETVFAWPGIGTLAYDAVQWRDYPVVQGVVLLISAIILMTNFLVDLLYATLDPRIRLA